MLNTFVLYTTTKPKNINLTKQYWILHFNEDCLQLLFFYL